MDTELNLYDYYTFTSNKNVIISYKGPVTDVIMAELSRDIRDKFSDNPKASRKLFAIFMELAQNILFYSAEKKMVGQRQESIGTILITGGTEHYTFGCGNLVENQYIQELVDACEHINTLDRDALREYKREKRSGAPGERSKGAGIGLIQVALTSENPLHAQHIPVNADHSFFSVSVKVHR
ncbi:MAG: hypothetical protein EAZ95_10865 [Bacteroidetes bacterium]|nr:MAG: hypothetical protein EAZ95_10865 [Bacteroidota bacterium]